MAPKSEYEAQLTAMRIVMEALAPLEEPAQRAVLAWAASQLGLGRPPTSEAFADAPKHTAAKREGTVSVVAQKIGAKSARELLLAAAAHLTLYQGKERFTKEELVATAKEGRGWKADYSNQMAFNIKRMADAGTLFEKAKNVFSLSDQAVTDLEGRLAR
jgi:hypothetical protein